MTLNTTAHVGQTDETSGVKQKRQTSGLQKRENGEDGEKSMGLLDSITAEDRVSIKISDLYRMMREAAHAEVMEELARKLDGNKMTGYVIKRLVREDEGEEHETDHRKE